MTRTADDERPVRPGRRPGPRRPVGRTGRWCCTGSPATRTRCEAWPRRWRPPASPWSSPCGHGTDRRAPTTFADWCASPARVDCSDDATVRRRRRRVDAGRHAHRWRAVATPASLELHSHVEPAVRRISSTRRSRRHESSPGSAPTSPSPTAEPATPVTVAARLLGASTRPTWSRSSPASCIRPRPAVHSRPLRGRSAGPVARAPPAAATTSPRRLRRGDRRAAHRRLRSSECGSSLAGCRRERVAGCARRASDAPTRDECPRRPPRPLELTEDELDLFTAQLAAVLEHAADVEALDVAGVPPTAHPTRARNVLRPDEVRPGLDREEVLAAAPAWRTVASRSRRSSARNHDFGVPGRRRPVLAAPPLALRRSHGTGDPMSAIAAFPGHAGRLLAALRWRSTSLASHW